MTPIKPTATKACQTLLETIARDVLDIPTLATQNRDQLDFHDVSVWSIADALQQAYAAGLDQGAGKSLNRSAISDASETHTANNDPALLVYLESRAHAELFCTFHGYSDYPSEGVLTAIEKLARDAGMIVTESAN